MEIVKSKEQIIKLRDVLKEEVENLPDKSLFGDSNDESKRQLHEWIKELDSALESVLIKNEDSEIYWWLIGKNDILSEDYGVD